jgi:lipooligosaccharide transport system ATP-binding protein
MVWQKLRSLRSQGVTMLLTTHYMEEAAHLCDRLVILHQGRIIAEGTPDELIRAHAGRDVIEVHATPAERLAVLRHLEGRHDVTVEEGGDILYVYATGENGFNPAALRDLAERVIYRNANLEDVFLKLTGRGLAEE